MKAAVNLVTRVVFLSVDDIKDFSTTVLDSKVNVTKIRGKF